MDANSVSNGDYMEIDGVVGKVTGIGETRKGFLFIVKDKYGVTATNYKWKDLE